MTVDYSEKLTIEKQRKLTIEERLRLKNQDWYTGRELLHLDYRENLTIEELTIEGFDCS